MSRFLSPLCAGLALVTTAACINRPVEDPGERGVCELPQYFPLSTEKDIDLLFVIDNSNSMADEQRVLAENFGNFIEALRSPKLGNKIPNVHIGVITTDLGAGSYGLPTCETTNGDGGRLQAEPRIPGCIPPSGTFIKYNEGVTNINNPAIPDPIDQVKDAFKCIAQIGTGGCGFEHQMEAARRALDGCDKDANNDGLGDCRVNPGFIRKDAFLAVVFLTDEDDCSAQKPQLFDNTHRDPDDQLGPLTSFRCFEFGIACDGNPDRFTVGRRTGCKPAGDWLFPVIKEGANNDYVESFKGLKPPGRVLMFAIAGPTDKVEVEIEKEYPVLRPSCQTKMGKAAPAIRVKALMDAFGKQGFFNKGTDYTGTQDLDVDICREDYSPALRLLGKVIVAELGGQCIKLPPLTRNGGLVCNQGDVLGTVGGQSVSCQSSCLDKADCVVQEIRNQATPQETSTVVDQCVPAKFTDPSDTRCDPCPCWRIIPKGDQCNPTQQGSPYGLEILRTEAEAPKGTVATTKCNTGCGVTTEKWGSEGFASLPQCN